MNAILIGYDLKRPGQNYSNLIKALKAYGTWWHGLDSTWMIKTPSSATQVRDALLQHIDVNDRILVADVTGQPLAWYGFDQAAQTWMLEQCPA